MTNREWMLLGCLADFLIACGGAVSGAMMQQGGVVLPGPAVWMLGGILGVVAVANHVKAARMEPPKGG